MKHLFNLSLVIICLLFQSSCSESDDDNVTIDFSGTYNVSVVENVIWGNSSGTVTDTGTIHISMTSSQNVVITGYFSTKGVITGSVLYLEGTRSQDNSGYITTTYGPATLSGKVLSFSSEQTGQLKNNGVLFPFRSSAKFTCIKQ